MDFVVCYGLEIQEWIQSTLLQIWDVLLPLLVKGKRRFFFVFSQVVQSVIGRVDVDDTGGHQTKTSKTKSILEGKNMQKQFLLFQICYLPFNLCFLKLFLVDFYLEFQQVQKRNYYSKNSSQLVECNASFFAYAYSEVPWVFLSSARWFECFKNGCLGNW